MGNNNVLICRENWMDVQAYLAYCEKTKRNTAATIKRQWGLLRHALEWSKDRPFPQSPSNTTSFPDYLEQVGIVSTRSDGKTGKLSPVTKRRALEELVRFFHFMRKIDPKRYPPHAVNDEWLASLKILTKENQVIEHEFYTFTEVERLAAAPNHDETLTQFRLRAAIALLFLSGMRVGALVTLPLKAINLSVAHPVIWQWGLYGVQTKNSKPINTYLLQIPNLLKIVTQWDDLVRSQLQPDALWFADITRDGMALTGKTRGGQSRGDAVRKGLHSLCESIGISYKHPHCLRHGHIVYAVKRARDMKALTAISQNVGHGDLTVTLQVYGKLTGDDIQVSIASLTQSDTFSPSTLDGANRDALIEQLSLTLKMLKGE
ncbi:MAG: site-specific integrase [Anaerolineae bacterium]|nr:site-specific integrase [Anaerolineae bacterium]